LDSLAELVRGFLMIGGFCAWEPTTAMHSMPHQPHQQAESKRAGTHTNKTVTLAVATLTDTHLLLKIAHCARPYLMLAVATPHVYARGHQARTVEHMLRRHTSSILVISPRLVPHIARVQLQTRLFKQHIMATCALGKSMQAAGARQPV
jgi:hypothetical protein